MLRDGLETGRGGHDRLHGAAGVVLDPLAQVRIGVFMSIVIDRRQRMVNFQDRHKGGDHHDGQQYGEGDRSRGPAQRTSDAWGSEQIAHGRKSSRTST
jgi:hypothetical protein